MTDGHLRRAPGWIRAAAALLPLVPAGRYRIAHLLRHVGGPPFQMHLPPALGGFTFHCDIRDSVAREVCFTGFYEPQETRIAAALLRPGMTAIDVGANWGHFTLAAAHWVGHAGRVVAFEPEPRLFTMLAGNVRRNELTRVTVQLAVGAAAGRARLRRFDESSGNWGTSQMSDGEGGAACDVVALDEQLDRDRVGVVDVVKSDVEGAEVDVVAGMRRGLASHRYRYILLECHPETLTERGRTIGECIQPMLANGYRAYSIDHSPAAHRRAAASAVAAARGLLRPANADIESERWPHLFLAAPARRIPPDADRHAGSRLMQIEESGTPAGGPS